MEQEPKIINGNGMVLLMSMQRELITHYQIIEGLPEYPLNIHGKVGQRLVKGYVAKLVEELSEAFHELFEAYKAVSTNRASIAGEHVKNYNIEIADVTHFLLEILIYCNIDEEYLLRALDNDLKTRGLEGILVDGDPYKTLFKLGYFLNQMDDTKIRTSQFHIFGHHQNMEYPEYSGGSKISEAGLDIHAKFLWYITHAFNTAMGFLKNKDWNSTEKKVNEINFYGSLLESVVMVFQYLDFAGFSDLGLFKIYVIKNNILKERIKNGY